MSGLYTETVLGLTIMQYFKNVEHHVDPLHLREKKSNSYQPGISQAKKVSIVSVFQSLQL